MEDRHKTKAQLIEEIAELRKRNTDLEAVLGESRFEGEIQQQNEFLHTVIESLAHPVFDREGKVVRMIEYFLDITERKSTEKTLSEREVQYRELADSITDVFFAMDQDLRCTYWNKASEELTKIAAKDAVGKSLYELFPDVKGTTAEKMYLEVLETKKARSFENRNRLGDRDYIFEISVYSTKAGCSGFSKDITKRKLAEQVLEQSEQRLSLIANGLPVLIAYIDTDQRYRFVNREYERWFGLKPAEIVGKTVREVLGEKDYDVFRDRAREVLAGQLVSYEDELPLQDGSSRHYHARYIPHVDDSGKVVGFFIMVEDISRRKRAEKEIAELAKFPAENPHPVLRVSKEGTILYQNQASSVLLHAWQWRKGQPLPPEWRSFILDALKTGASRQTEFECCPDGRTFVITFTPLTEFDCVNIYALEINSRRKVEERLRKSEERLKEAQRIGMVGGWEFDVQTQEISWSEQVYRLFERDPKQGPPTYEQNMVYYYPEDSEKFQEQVRVAIETGRNFDTDYHLKLPSGKSVYQRGLIRAERDENGRVIKLYGTVQDITERKQAEIELRQSEEKYRSIFENSAVGIAQTSPEGKFLEVNPAYASMLGYESSREVIDSIDDIAEQVYVNPEKRKEILRSVLKSEGVLRYECDFKRRDGKQWIGDVVLRLVRDEKNNPLYLESFVMDITKRKQAEQEREKLLYDMGKRIKELKCMYGVTDATRRHDSLEAIFSDVVVIMPDGWAFPQIACARIVFDGREYATERFEPTRWKQESEIVVNGKARGLVEICYLEEHPTKDEGPFLKEERDLIDGISFSLSEAIELRLAEEEVALRQQQLVQAKKMTSIGVLSSGIAHEINNPNQVISLYAPRLQGAWESIVPILEEYYMKNGDFLIAGRRYREVRDKMPAYLGRIHESSKRIDRIINDLRSFARPDNVGVQTKLDINVVVRSSITLVSHLIKKTTNRFSVHLGKKLPRTRGNIQKLEQVLVNLIQNACHALQDKDQAVTVETSYEDERQSLRVDVHDEGIGIPPENIDKITEPFYTSKRSDQGTGLGLSVSANIIHEHRGILSFASEPGKGTSATVYLPVSNKPQSGATNEH